MWEPEENVQRSSFIPLKALSWPWERPAVCGGEGPCLDCSWLSISPPCTKPRLRVSCNQGSAGWRLNRLELQRSLISKKNTVEDTGLSQGQKTANLRQLIQAMKQDLRTAGTEMQWSLGWQRGRNKLSVIFGELFTVLHISKSGLTSLKSMQLSKCFGYVRANTLFPLCFTKCN